MRCVSPRRLGVCKSWHSAGVRSTHPGVRGTGVPSVGATARGRGEQAGLRVSGASTGSVWSGVSAGTVGTVWRRAWMRLHGCPNPVSVCEQPGQQPVCAPLGSEGGTSRGLHFQGAGVLNSCLSKQLREGTGRSEAPSDRGRACCGHPTGRGSSSGASGRPGQDDREALGHRTDSWGWSERRYLPRVPHSRDRWGV